MIQPDDLIIIDALIHRHGNAAEIESWQKIKLALFRAAHPSKDQKTYKNDTST